MLDDNTHHWFRSHGEALLEALPIPCRQAVHSFQATSDSDLIEQVLLVLFVALQYGQAWSPDKIVNHLHQLGAFSEEYTENRLLSDIVCPVRTLFVGCHLKLDRYWDPTSPWIDFLIYQAILRQQSGEDETSIQNDIKHRWAFEDPSYLLDRAKLRAKYCSSVFTEVRSWGEGQLTSEVHRNELEEKQRKVAFCISEEAKAHPVLVDFLSSLLLIEYLESLAEKGELKFDNANKATFDHYRTLLLECPSALFLWEDELVTLHNSEATKLDHCLQLLPILQKESGDLASNVEVGVPTELINGQEYIPQWLQDYVFSAGGRFCQNSLGPIPYLFLVLEASESDTANSEIGLLDPVVSDQEVTLTLCLMDSETPIHVDFCFAFRSPETLRTLMLIVELKSFRFDVLVTRENGTLTLAHSGIIRLKPDYLAVLNLACLDALKNIYGDSPEVLRDAMANEMTDPIAGFLMCENAKSERLFIDTSPIPSDASKPPVSDRWEEFSTLRSQVLDLQSEWAANVRAGQLDQAAQNLSQFDTIEESYRRIQQELRGLDKNCFESVAGMTGIEVMAESLDSNHRCFLHFGFHRNELVAFFIVLRDGEIVADSVRFPDFVQEQAIDYTNEWLLSSGEDEEDEARSALDDLLELLGTGIGRPLAAALKTADVHHVVISSSCFLELVPLHCIPVDSSGSQLFMDAFESITYAPSLKLLHRNRRPADPGGITALSYSPSDSPLPFAASEAQCIASIFPTCNLIRDHEATPEALLAYADRSAILHVACHGDWVPSDQLLSALVLKPTAAESGDLCVASLLARDQMDNLALVTLSACDSGRHLQEINKFQEFRGLDGIFLALGVRAVVASLWSIGDFSALLVMARFYCDLTRGHTIEVALKNSMNQLRNGYLDNMPADDLLERTLDSVEPTWRDRLQHCSADLQHPIEWGAFRCNGTTWNRLVVA